MFSITPTMRLGLVRVVWIAALIATGASRIWGQELPECATTIEGCAEGSTVPGVNGATGSGEQNGGDRIVEGRPRLYSLKRALYPMNWFEAGVRPIFRVFAPEPSQTFGGEPPKTNGIKLGLAGAGAGSGFGPRIVFFHKPHSGGVELELPLLVTFRRYEIYEFNARFPLIPGSESDHLRLELSSGYRTRTSDRFFGMGNDSALSDRSGFRTVTRELAAGFSTRLDHVWRGSLRAVYQNVGVTEPRKVESAQQAFGSKDIPGLLGGAEIRSAVLAVTRDTTNHRLPTRGGLLQAEASLNDGVRKGDFSYWKYRVQFHQFFPLDAGEGKIIAIRAMAETNQERRGSNIPFFDLATLGDWNNLRGFEQSRFYDKSALSFGVEYRYRIWRAFDWALFTDRGQVAPEPGDFGAARFHSSYGARLIALPRTRRPITIDAARSREGWRIYLNFNPEF